MWHDCMLDGEALDEATTQCARNLALPGIGIYPFRPATNPAHFLQLIESQQIFLSPPHEREVSATQGSGWKRRIERHEFWSATVSARTRTFKNAHGYDCVGRGIGPTAAIAAARAFVASCKDVEEIPF